MNPPGKRSVPSLGSDLLRGVRRRLSFQCSGCDYGAVSSAHPRRCPMCGGETWDMAPRRLFPERLR